MIYIRDTAVQEHPRRLTLDASSLLGIAAARSTAMVKAGTTAMMEASIAMASYCVKPEYYCGGDVLRLRGGRVIAKLSTALTTE
jgi:hypothetical protein